MQFIDGVNDVDLNPRRLQFAVAVAHTGSFTEAAAACHVTQPTLSTGIAQLEAAFGAKLFVRTTRSVALTPFGTHVLPYMAEVLRAQDTLGLQARQFLQPAQRLLRIGTSPLIRGTLVSLMVEPFRTRVPGVEVVLREMNMQDLHRMLGDGLLDVVIGVAGPHREPWMTAPLYREPLLYLPRAASATLRPRRDTVTLAEIASETFVMVPDACGLARATRDLFRRHRRALHEYQGEAMSYQVLEEWAALGIGAAILPQSKVTDAHAACRITDRAGVPVTIGFEATWLRSSAKVPHVQAFAQHLTKVVPRIVAGLGYG